MTDVLIELLVIYSNTWDFFNLSTNVHTRTHPHTHTHTHIGMPPRGER